jgi:hypothetical protein
VTNTLARTQRTQSAFPKVHRAANAGAQRTQSTSQRDTIYPTIHRAANAGAQRTQSTSQSTQGDKRRDTEDTIRIPQSTQGDRHTRRGRGELLSVLFPVCGCVNSQDQTEPRHNSTTTRGKVPLSSNFTKRQDCRGVGEFGGTRCVCVCACVRSCVRACVRATADLDTGILTFLPPQL